MAYENNDEIKTNIHPWEGIYLPRTDDTPVYRDLSDIKNDREFIETCLYGPADVDHMPFEFDVLSPTPLDPVAIKERESRMPYTRLGLEFMHRRLNNQVEKLNNSNANNLSETLVSAIGDEIDFEHNNQVVRNARAIEKIKAIHDADPSRFTKEVAEIIYSCRIGTASRYERAFLLSLFPEIEAIDNAQFTSPLNTKEYRKAGTQQREELLAMQFQHGLDLTLVDRGNGTGRFIDVSETAHDSILVAKGVIATLTLNNTRLECVQRDSLIGFPTVPQLRGTAENILRTKDGRPFNAQPLRLYSYWRIAKADSDSLDA
ncbi:MAG: hypothetical protein WAR37_03485 [Candidatus Microsaccharimonas sp.]